HVRRVRALRSIARDLPARIPDPRASARVVRIGPGARDRLLQGVRANVTGAEAIARALEDAGVRAAYSFPGSPATKVSLALEAGRDAGGRARRGARAPRQRAGRDARGRAARRRRAGLAPAGTPHLDRPDLRISCRAARAPAGFDRAAVRDFARGGPAWLRGGR